MSDINPENYAEFTTQDGPGNEEPPRVEDLQPPDMVEDPRSQIVLLPKSLVQ
ncbi:hypothetical protein [Actinoplanes derwentensis]|uniref:Uncharacterized protein n=1 Tax=Actinoplanes derwentensis TaxID=113562 RepID=A0A1H2C9Q7_9ACTN|nr:hypothetical protein [Actinoplanes derwentensis]GID89094.1 hypothetical protein Ade03nite_80180 [Actinoplanes derwentensis]SDT67104.1 hypothetical protein SAMN04489716_5428 [Actinoplanes derwentensis]